MHISNNRMPNRLNNGSNNGIFNRLDSAWRLFVSDIEDTFGSRQQRQSIILPSLSPELAEIIQSNVNQRYPNRSTLVANGLIRAMCSHDSTASNHPPQAIPVNYLMPGDDLMEGIPLSVSSSYITFIGPLTRLPSSQLLISPT